MSGPTQVSYGAVSIVIKNVLADDHKSGDGTPLAGDRVHFEADGIPYNPVPEEDDDIWVELQKKGRLFSCGTSPLSSRVGEFSPKATHTLFSNAYGKPPQAVEKLLQLLSLDQIKAALAEFHQVSQDDLNNLITQLSTAVQSAQKFASSRPPVSKYGIFKLLKIVSDYEPHNLFDAAPKVQLYMMMFFLPFISIGAIGLISAEVPVNPLYLLLASASVFWSLPIGVAVSDYFSSTPTDIKPMDNYTVTARDAESLSGREDVIGKVLSCWQFTNKEVRQHPLLVGPAGVGKSVIFTELARRIALGQVPDILKGKTMFGGPAASLLPTNPMFESNDKMERFFKKILAHKEDIVLVLDEIQAILNEQYGPRYGEVLKSALDTSSRGLTYFMAATTEEEYFKYIASDAARLRRFFVIHVPPLSKEEVKRVLREMAQRQYPHIPISDPFLDHIYVYAEKLSLYLKQEHPKLHPVMQPQFSKTLLMRAVSQVVLKQTEAPSAEAFYQHKGVLANLHSQLLFLQNPQAAIALTKEILAEKARVKELGDKMNEELRHIHALKTVNEELEKQQKEVRSLATRIEAIRNRAGEYWIMAKASALRSCLVGESEESLLKKFVLHQFYTIPRLYAEKQKLESQLSPPLGEEQVRAALRLHYEELLKNNKIEGQPLPFLQAPEPQVAAV